MLITETDGDALKVSVFNQDAGRLEDYGWIGTDELAGWTISKYDWDSFLRKESP